jgi:FkbM family methyltransferase
MLGEKLLYYLLDYTLSNSFEKKIIKQLNKNKKKLVIFDVGCYRGIFAKSILNLIGNRKYKLYLFEINRKAKKYLENILKLKNIYYNEVALYNKNGMANYNYNTFFESAGSSLSNIIKNDTKWNFSRKLLMKILLQSPKNYIKYKVPTITIDSFLKKNKIKSIDILKIDVEGSEYELLQGAKNALIQEKIKIILIEIIGKKNLYIQKEKKILNLLKGRNFTLMKKKNILSVSLFSNLKGGDYLFINSKYLKS